MAHSTEMSARVSTLEDELALCRRELREANDTLSVRTKALEYAQETVALLHRRVNDMDNSAIVTHHLLNV